MEIIGGADMCYVPEFMPQLDSIGAQYTMRLLCSWPDTNHDPRFVTAPGTT
jgi:hypothetical protein